MTLPTPTPPNTPPPNTGAATDGPRLGLRANLAQFSLLVAVNALVGATLGQERTVVPLLAKQTFHLTGFVSALSRYPDQGLFVIVLSNNGDTSARQTANDLAAIALGEKYELPQPPGAKPKEKDAKRER